MQGSGNKTLSPAWKKCGQYETTNTVQCKEADKQSVLSRKEDIAHSVKMPQETIDVPLALGKLSVPQNRTQELEKGLSQFLKNASKMKERGKSYLLDQGPHFCTVQNPDSATQHESQNSINYYLKKEC